MNSKELFKADSTTKIKHLNENDYAVLLNQKGWQIYELDKDENFKKKSPDDLYCSMILKFNSACYIGYITNSNDLVLIDKATGIVVYTIHNSTTAWIDLQPLSGNLFLTTEYNKKLETNNCIISCIKDSKKIDLIHCEEALVLGNYIIKVIYKNDTNEHLFSCSDGLLKELTYFAKYPSVEILNISKKFYILVSKKKKSTYVVDKVTGKCKYKYDSCFKLYYEHKDYAVLHDAFNSTIKALISKENMKLSPLCYDYTILGEKYFFLSTNTDRGLGTILKRNDFSVIATNIDFDTITHSNDTVIFFDSKKQKWFLDKSY